MVRQLVARHFRKKAAKNTAWAVSKSGFKCPHWVLSQSCWSQQICRVQLTAWTHSLCCCFAVGLRWQQ